MVGQHFLTDLSSGQFCHKIDHTACTVLWCQDHRKSTCVCKDGERFIEIQSPTNRNTLLEYTEAVCDIGLNRFYAILDSASGELDFGLNFDSCYKFILK